MEQTYKIKKKDLFNDLRVPSKLVPVLETSSYKVSLRIVWRYK